MPPSCELPGSRKPRSSFCSVDWLSQSSCAGPTHTPRPTPVPWGGLAAPARVPHSREPLQTSSIDGARGTSVAGLCKEPDPAQAPRIRTAFTAAQVSTLESAFQRRQYLGPLERKKLAREMQLSEAQIKTWFQNRRMKHKRQMQDSQLNGPFSGCLYLPLVLCPPPSALGSGLQPLCPEVTPPGPQPLMLPAGSFWSPCPLEQASLGSTWASCSQQPLAPSSPWEPAAHAGTTLVWGTLELGHSLGAQGCLLKRTVAS